MGGAEQLYPLIRNGFGDDFPEALEIIKNITLNDKQLGKLEFKIKESENPEEGACAWIKENQKLANGWLPEG